MAAAYQCDRCKKFGAYDITRDSIGNGKWRFIPSRSTPHLTFCDTCFEAFKTFMEGGRIDPIPQVSESEFAGAWKDHTYE